ncbi:uncharacterized protein LOC134181231 [Corticium candelabrum]|uniref:uncharacterized protein LOC134181231 n=1 Tax=Corticium candelabrum TaxID=121492 RepID=UPI002E255EB1|nr:uncharacterized protein LOC134181231 [Corticium candelabrum]XP_062504457.1 uncharacterized protein LOC134181231 [Corticium candelabrum]
MTDEGGSVAGEETGGNSLAYMCECEIARANGSRDGLTAALELAEEALSVAQSSLTSDSSYIGYYKNHVASCHAELGNHEKTIQLLEECIKIEEKLPDSQRALCTTMQHMGVEYTRVSNFSKAIEWIKKSLDLQQQQNPPHHLNIADGFLSLGDVYRRMDNYVEALPHFKKSVDIREQEQLMSNISTGQAYYDLGACHVQLLRAGHPKGPGTHSRIAATSSKMEQAEQARDAFTKCIVVLSSRQDHYQYTLKGLEGLGGLCGISVDHKSFKDLDKADKLRLVARKVYACRDYARAEQLLQVEKVVRHSKTASSQSTAIVLHDIGLCEMRLSKLDRAEKTFTETLKIMQSLRPQELEDLQMLYIKNLVGLVRFLKCYQQSLH